MRKATSKRPVAPIPSQAATEVESKRWLLKLYIAGAGVKSRMAFANLKQICEQHLAGQYQIEVIDLFESPQLAKGDQILAIPTVVRRLPAPIRKVIGDLSNAERVFVGLDIKPLPV